jgi:hypothetical protein
MHPLDHHGGAPGTDVPCMLVAGRGGIRGGAGRLGAFLDGAVLRRSPLAALAGLLVGFCSNPGRSKVT